MNDVRRSCRQHFSQIEEMFGNAEAFAKLPSHERFLIANSHDLAIRDAMDRLHMLVGDLSATDYGDAKHLLFR